MNARLQQALAVAGMSQSELARRLGIDQSVVNRWVSGQRVPRPMQLALMREILGAASVEALGFRLVQSYHVEAVAG
jgi:transcriptional regulator with XRE-family HTH domain